MEPCLPCQLCLQGTWQDLHPSATGSSQVCKDSSIWHGLVDGLVQSSLSAQNVDASLAVLATQWLWHNCQHAEVHSAAAARLPAILQAQLEILMLSFIVS
jgi:hypothetical protein